MRTKHFMMCAASLAVGLALMVGCGDSEEPAGSGTSPALTDESDLNKAVYCMKHIIRASVDYNDKKDFPSTYSEGGKVVATCGYNPNGALGYVSISQNSPLTSSAIASFIYSAPTAAFSPSVSKEEALSAAIKVMFGTYNYAADSSNAIAYFSKANDKFTSLDNLKKITNNNAVTEELYGSLSFTVNSYKMIVFGKNKEGVLIGKYVGYSTGSAYKYWCINPENADFGTSGVKAYY